MIYGQKLNGTQNYDVLSFPYLLKFLYKTSDIAQCHLHTYIPSSFHFPPRPLCEHPPWYHTPGHCHRQISQQAADSDNDNDTSTGGFIHGVMCQATMIICALTHPEHLLKDEDVNNQLGIRELPA